MKYGVILTIIKVCEYSFKIGIFYCQLMLATQQSEIKVADDASNIKNRNFSSLEEENFVKMNCRAHACNELRQARLKRTF